MFNFHFFFQQEENLLDVLQLVLSIMTEQPDTTVPVLDKMDGLRYVLIEEFQYLVFELVSSLILAVRVFLFFIYSVSSSGFCFVSWTWNLKQLEFTLWRLLGAFYSFVLPGTISLALSIVKRVDALLSSL